MDELKTISYRIVHDLEMVHVLCEQIRSIISIDVILQSTWRIEPVSAYFAFETFEEVQEVDFWYIQVSDVWIKCIWFFILSTILNVLMQKLHTKSFEISKLAIKNISDLYAWMPQLWLFKSPKEVNLLVHTLHLNQSFRYV